MLVGRQIVDRSQQTVLQSDPPFMHFLRREYPKYKDLLFLMRFKDGLFSICGWTYKSSGRFVELLALGPGLNFTQAKREAFDLVMNPPKQDVRTGPQLSRAIASQQRDQDRQVAGEQEAMLDHKKHLYHRAATGGYGDLPYWDDVR